MEQILETFCNTTDGILDLYQHAMTGLRQEQPENTAIIDQCILNGKAMIHCELDLELGGATEMKFYAIHKSEKVFLTSIYVQNDTKNIN